MPDIVFHSLMKYVLFFLVIVATLGGGVYYYLQYKNAPFYIMVESPQGGETYRTGETIVVKWRAYNLHTISPERMKYINVRLGLAQPETVGMEPAIYEISKELPLEEEGAFTWTIDENIKPGDYKLRVATLGVGKAPSGDLLWGLAYHSLDAFTIANE